MNRRADVSVVRSTPHRALVICSLAAALLLAGTMAARPLDPAARVRGWTLLSESETAAARALAAARRYEVNHLQLSHQIVHDLREVKDDGTRRRVNRLIDAAHSAGIEEVVLWDHALYDLDYYPAEFRTGPGRTLDLDAPAFWEWLKADYRRMLDRVPAADGLVLTFIETGARAERQFSRRFGTPGQKLAAVVNAVADVVIGERKLALYARTFAYTEAEYAAIAEAISLFARPEIRLMMKETPHDFFLTHPHDRLAGTIPRATIMEFDLAGEFNGQGIIANTWPEYVLRRWRHFARQPHVVGVTARIDRYGDTCLVGGPGEINILALHRGSADAQVTAEQIYDEFVEARYGRAAKEPVKAALKQAYDIVTSTLYTLGTNTADHSELNYDPYLSNYVRHVSGRWLDPPIVYVGHGVDREVHCWRDVVNHIAPAFAKSPTSPQAHEAPQVAAAGWLQQGEQLTESWLRLIVTEKDHGVRLAKEALDLIDAAKPSLAKDRYEELRHVFARTWLTARLHRAVAATYFGFRVYCRGSDYQTPFVRELVAAGLADSLAVAAEIRAYPVKPTVGQWDWVRDAAAAERYHALIVHEGWPVETNGFRNPNGGMRFQLTP